MGQAKQNSIKRAGVGYTIGNYLIRGLGFLTVPIFSRLLSTADYGFYNTYTSYESILFIFVGLALHTSFKNARLKFVGELNNYVSSCILLSFFNMLIFLCGANLICALFHVSNYVYISVLVLHSFGTAIIGYYNTYISLNYQTRDYIRLSFFYAVGNLLLSIFLLLTVCKENRAYGRIFGTFFPCFCLAVWIVAGFWKKSKPIVNKNYWGYALKYSLPIIPHGISQVLLGSFDRIMIANIIGNSQAGIYSFAYNVYAIISVTYSSLDQVWSPWFYERMSQGDREEIRNCADKYALGMALFTLGVMLVSPEIIQLLGTAEYQEAIYITIPIIIGGFFSYLYSFPAIVEYYYEKTKFIAIGTMCAASINIFLNYIFIPWFGYVAAVYTTLITYILYFLFHTIISIWVNKGNLYNGKGFFMAAFIIIAGGIVAQLFISNIWIRWVLGFIDAMALCWFLNCQFGIIGKIKSGFRKKE